MAKKKAGAATKKKTPGKGTARVQWKTEAIPMPIPKGRKLPTPKKKPKKR